MSLEVMITRFGFKLADNLLNLTPLQSAYYIELANKIITAENQAVRNASKKRGR